MTEREKEIGKTKCPDFFKTAEGADVATGDNKVTIGVSGVSGEAGDAMEIIDASVSMPYAPVLSPRYGVSASKGGGTSRLGTSRNW